LSVARPVPGWAEEVSVVTTRRLVLVRHAKAAAEGDVDAERPLAARGARDAPAVGRWLAQQGIAPDRVVVSTARRAQQTWALAAAELGQVTRPVADERVHDNTVEALLQVVGDTPSEVKTLVLVGHNPSMEELAAALDDGGGDPDARTLLAQGFPTSGVAVFLTRQAWSRVSTGTATLTNFGTAQS
jgi:phosphohistidine phosphatase